MLLDIIITLEKIVEEKFSQQKEKIFGLNMKTILE